MGRPLPPGAVSAPRLYAGACASLLARLEVGLNPSPAAEVWRGMPEWAKDYGRETADVQRVTAFLRNHLNLRSGWPSRIPAFRERLEEYLRIGMPRGVAALPLAPEEVEGLADDLPDADDDDANDADPSRHHPPKLPPEDFGDELPPGALAGLTKAAIAEASEASNARQRDRRGRGGSGRGGAFDRPEGVKQALAGLDPTSTAGRSELEVKRRLLSAIQAQMMISPGSAYRGLVQSYDNMQAQIRQLEQEGGDNEDLDRDPVACAVAILEELENAMVLLGVPAFKARDLAAACREAANVAERPPPPPPPPPSGNPAAAAGSGPGWDFDLPEEDDGEGW